MSELRSKLQLSDAKLAGRATICMTGSYGRREAGEHSDLDVVIVGLDDVDAPQTPLRSQINPSRLANLDAICIKGELIETTRSLSMNDFDSDGRYLTHYSVSELVGKLGRPEDDAGNTFTARLLMLLEGRPLLEPSAFSEIVDSIIESYWRDFEGHEAEFAPAFITNDILRLWRTFCVNYEARTASTPDHLKGKRRLKNFKLKFSRLLTCYSALLSIAHVFAQNGTVTPIDMRAICDRTPLDRIVWLQEQTNIGTADGALTAILERYNHFLSVTDDTEISLIAKFADPDQLAVYLESSYSFAQAIFEAMNLIGRKTKMHRMMVV